MKKIEHIGIAVKDIEASNKVFTTIFGKENYKTEKVELEEVVTSFFQIGESKIELVAATTEESQIFKCLEKWGEGMHHVAFAVEDIKKEDEKQGMENKNNEVKKELSKEKHNSLEIQAEMPGLSSSDPNLPESNENIDKKNDNDGNNEEDLEIPSFLRNQSN